MTFNYQLSVRTAFTTMSDIKINKTKPYFHDGIIIGKQSVRNGTHIKIQLPVHASLHISFLCIAKLSFILIQLETVQ